MTNTERERIPAIRRSAIAALAVALGACGGPSDGYQRVAVTGTVTLDGKDLPTGTISFIPQGKGASASTEITEGKFASSQREGLSPGTYRVEIYSVQSTGRRVISADDPNVMVDEVTNVIPRRYNVDSTLNVQIDPGKEPEPLSFTLTSEKPARK